MIIVLNNQRRSCKIKSEKSEFSRTCIMRKDKKRFFKKNQFFFHDIDHETEKELEKNLRIAFIDGFCFISPKIISLRRNKTHKNALYKPCVFTKDKWCSMLPIFAPVSLSFFFFTVFGREGGAGTIYLGPYYTKS